VVKTVSAVAEAVVVPDVTVRVVIVVAMLVRARKVALLATTLLNSVVASAVVVVLLLQLPVKWSAMDHKGTRVCK
jgi:hypothetical protein